MPLPFRPLACSFVDDGAIHCTECGRAVDEVTTIAERWLYYSDSRDLFPYCPECAEREFAEDAPGSGEAQAIRRAREV